MFEIAIVTSLLFVGLLAGSVWIGLSLFATGYILLSVFKPNIPMDIFSSGVIWGSMIPSPLLSLPLFILMSEVLVAAGLGRSLFSGLAPWVGRLPGGLLHINVVGSTLFAAVSGSSAATTAIVGKVSLPELHRRGYDRNLAMGSLAGAGTLGFLIPPSIIMIIYGVVAEVSILELFIAGVIPGLTLAALYMIYIALHQKITGSQPRADKATRRDLLRGLYDIGPITGLIATIMGSLYLGFASVSELAALGVLGAVVIAILKGRFSFPTMIAAACSAHFSHDWADHSWCGTAEFCFRFSGDSKGDCKSDCRTGVIAFCTDRHSFDFLRRAWHVSGWHVDYRHDLADHPAVDHSGWI